jgi:hypothetical protein
MRDSADILWFVACAIGAILIAVLIVIFRRARAQRELELAEQILDEDLRSLDASRRTPSS